MERRHDAGPRLDQRSAQAAGRAGARARRTGSRAERRAQVQRRQSGRPSRRADRSTTDPFSLSLRLKPTETQDRAIVLHQSRAWSDAGSRGFELTLDHGRPFFGLIHFWPGNAIAVRARQRPAPQHLVAPGRDLRRIEPRGGHPAVSRRRAARDRRRARSSVQGHRLRRDGGRSLLGHASVHDRRALPRQRLQERLDRRPAGVRCLPDRSGSRRRRPTRSRATPPPSRTSSRGSISRTSRRSPSSGASVRRRTALVADVPEIMVMEEMRRRARHIAQARRLRRAGGDRAARHAGQPAAVPQRISRATGSAWRAG